MTNEEKIILIDKAFIESLEEFGITSENFHLLTHEESKSFNQIFARKLLSQHLDLSWETAISPAFGFRVDGNKDGIIGSYCLGLKTKALTSVSEEQVNDILNKNVTFYLEDKFGYVQNKISKEEVKANYLPYRKSYNMGYGSCASTQVKSINWEIDKNNNVLISKGWDIYD